MLHYKWKLEVQMHKTLKNSVHAQQVIKKPNEMLTFIARVREINNREVLMRVWNLLLRLYLQS